MIQSTRALQIFIAVAEELHFRKAAERLHMTQPPLSMQIKQLEKWIGVDLLSRTTRSVQLTPAGKELQQRATRLLAEFEEMAEAVRRVGRGDVGSLSLGFPASTMFDILPNLLAIQQNRYPQVALNLKESPSPELLESLRARELDVALVRTSPLSMEPDLEYILAARESMVVALPSSHPLARLDTIPIQRLNRIPLIGFAAKGSRYFQELVRQIFEAHQLQPLIVHESVVPTILALVEAGLGLAIVPASMATLKTTELTYRPLSGAHGLDISTLYCVWRRADCTPVVKNFAEIVSRSDMAAAVKLLPRMESGPPPS